MGVIRVLIKCGYVNMVQNGPFGKEAPQVSCGYLVIMEVLAGCHLAG